ncbi:hypothetical protein LEP1GSC088_0896 [Leptospira interrogans str. L1207]|nr:hypothetical protein LEP1GSC088_0896 [Leptospira interrogans str. L1207]
MKRKEDLTFLKLTSNRKAAFEILTDDLSHGMKPEVWKRKIIGSFNFF